MTKTTETFWYFRKGVFGKPQSTQRAQRGRKIKITTLCVPLCSLWFNLTCHDRILRKSEKVHVTRITREPNIYVQCWGTKRIIPNNVSKFGTQKRVVRMSKTETKLREHLDADALFSLIHSGFERIKDHRSKNIKIPKQFMPSSIHLITTVWDYAIARGWFVLSQNVYETANSPSLTCVYKYNENCCWSVRDFA